MAGDLLSEQLSQFPTRDIPGICRASTCMFAACPFRDEFRGERCVELTTSHALLILRQCHNQGLCLVSKFDKPWVMGKSLYVYDTNKMQSVRDRANGRMLEVPHNSDKNKAPQMAGWPRLADYVTKPSLDAA